MGSATPTDGTSPSTPWSSSASRRTSPTRRWGTVRATGGGTGPGGPPPTRSPPDRLSSRGRGVTYPAPSAGSTSSARPMESASGTARRGRAASATTTRKTASTRIPSGSSLASRRTRGRATAGTCAASLACRVTTGLAQCSRPMRASVSATQGMRAPTASCSVEKPSSSRDGTLWRRIPTCGSFSPGGTPRGSRARVASASGPAVSSRKYPSKKLGLSRGCRGIGTTRGRRRRATYTACAMWAGRGRCAPTGAPSNLIRSTGIACCEKTALRSTRRCARSSPPGRRRSSATKGGRESLTRSTS
mmetsp:Transcript_6504/g.22428  ORF Transcript_6504/g.22428 Transcript_6504/m.22428 type:complete len:303 (-) Transcript_6504:5133-6041(-)